MSTQRANCTRPLVWARSSHAGRQLSMNPQPHTSANAASGVQTLKLNQGKLMASSEKEWTPKSMMTARTPPNGPSSSYGSGPRRTSRSTSTGTRPRQRPPAGPRLLVRLRLAHCPCHAPGTSFEEATTDIMQDVTAFQEAVLLPAAQTRPSGGKGRRPNAYNDLDDHPRTPVERHQGQEQKQGQGQAEHLEETPVERPVQ